MSKWKSSRTGRTVLLYEKLRLRIRIEDTASLLVKAADPESITREQGSLMQDLFQDNGNKGFVDQARDTTVEELKCMIAAYTRMPVFRGFSAGDGMYAGPEHIAVSMWLPEGFSSTTMDMLAEAGEDYLVYSILQKWSAVVAPGLQEKILALQAAAEEKVKGYLNVRTVLVRRRSSIF